MFTYKRFFKETKINNTSALSQVLEEFQRKSENRKTQKYKQYTGIIFSRGQYAVLFDGKRYILISKNPSRFPMYDPEDPFVMFEAKEMLPIKIQIIDKEKFEDFKHLAFDRGDIKV